MYTNHTIHFTSITPLPDESYWTQGYHAGNLHVLLTIHAPTDEETSTLARKGQHILHHLETEFFSLQTKSYTSVRACIEECVAENASVITTLMVVVTTPEMYLYVYGQGHIFLLRGETAGQILAPADHLVSVTGEKQPGDRILLITSAFLETLTTEKLFAGALLEETEFHELFLAYLHETNSPLAACARITLDPAELNESYEESALSEAKDDDHTAEQENQEIEKISEDAPLRVSFPHKKRLLWTITALVVVAFVFSLFLYQKNAEYKRIQRTYQSQVLPLEGSITDAQAIASINPLASKQQLDNARQKLLMLSSQFPPHTPEYDKVQSLLSRIQTSPSVPDTLTVAKEPSMLLTYLHTHKDASMGFENETAFYVIDTHGVEKVTRSSSAVQQLIPLSSITTPVKSLVSYNDNIYILTATDILKYVASGSHFNSNSYFATATDVSQATSIAVDQSIWVGLQDGSIQKFTRGKLQTFSYSPSSQRPRTISALFTTVDDPNLYAIDLIQSLLFIISKTGTNIKTIPLGGIHSMQAATLLPDASSLHLLVQDTIYAVPLH